MGKKKVYNPHGRYQNPGNRRNWTTAEEMLIWPIMAPIGRESVYRQTAWALCQILGREPAVGGPVKAVSLLHVRKNTYGLSDPDPELVMMARDVWTGRRTGLDLSWAERTQLLQQHHRKELNPNAREGRVDVRAVLAFLDRSSADADRVESYLRGLKGRARSKADAEHSGPIPLVGREDEAADIINRWLRLADTDDRLWVWRELLDFLDRAPRDGITRDGPDDPDDEFSRIPRRGSR